MNNITEIENEIKSIYEWHAQESKRVVGEDPVYNEHGDLVPRYTRIRTQETGHLANLWALAARLSPEEYPDG